MDLRGIFDGPEHELSCNNAFHLTSQELQGEPRGHHMRHAVLDSNCLIHLRDSSLFESFCKLRNYEISIPSIVFHRELLYFSNVQKNELLASGLNLVEITLEKMEYSEILYKNSSRLSINELVVFVLASPLTNCLLLTGDNALRRYSESQGIEVHGVIWIILKLHRQEIASSDKFLHGLEKLRDNPKVWIPNKIIDLAIK